MDIRHFSIEYLSWLIMEKMAEGYHPVYQGYMLYFIK